MIKIIEKGITSLFFNLISFIIWVFIAYIQLNTLMIYPTIFRLGLFIYFLLFGSIFLIRRRSKTPISILHLILAAIITISPWFVFIDKETNIYFILIFGIVIEAIGLFGMFISLISLGKSFGIAPANRGIVTKGPYKIIRHPLYLSELFVILGYTIGNLSLWNFLMLVLLSSAQVFRLLEEERILRKDKDYINYSNKVKIRLLPYIW